MVSTRWIGRWISTFLVVLLTVAISNAQSQFPDFLVGTWKVDDQEVYEHWDQIHKHALKGFSYRIQNGQVIPTEYLEVVQEEDDILYLATIPYANSGETIRFSQTQSGKRVVFENPDHDFPRIITYETLSPSQIQVVLSDGENKQISYELIRVESESEIKDSTNTNPHYNPGLARKLGADD